jgi:hypothetical protein
MRLSLLLLLLAPVALCQDTFEIQVYEYETVPKGQWNLETHVNFVGSGTKKYEGTVAPTNDQLHLTYELTRGITNRFEMAGYLVLARRPGNSLDYVAARIRPRYAFPESWHLPMKTSLSVEVGFPRTIYEENTITLEVRPILEREFGRWQLDINPVVGRALRGPGRKEGWDFEPGIRMAYKLTRRWEPSLEYYASTGPLRDILPFTEQAHLFYPGFDYNINDNLVLNFGVGWAATEGGNKLTFKMRIGWLFGQKSP